MVKSMQQYPRATVGAIIENDGKILLVKRNSEPYKDLWCIPGGHIDSMETAEHAVIREVKEETGLNFKPAFFKCYDEIIPEIGWHAVIQIFSGRAEGKEHIEMDDVKEVKWFDAREAMKMKLAFKHNEILKEYFEVKK